MNKKPLIIAVVIIVVAVGWLVLKGPEVPSTSQVVPGTGKAPGDAAEAAVEKSGLGGQLFNSVNQNPADNIPNTAPLQNNLNPYKGGYTNPF